MINCCTCVVVNSVHWTIVHFPTPSKHTTIQPYSPQHRSSQPSHLTVALGLDVIDPEVCDLACARQQLLQLVDGEGPHQVTDVNHAGGLVARRRGLSLHARRSPGRLRSVATTAHVLRSDRGVSVSGRLWSRSHIHTPTGVGPGPGRQDWYSTSGHQHWYSRIRLTSMC